MRRSRSFCRKSRLEWQYHHRINPDVSAAPAASANLGCASRRSPAWPRVSRAAACSLGMRDAEPSKVGEPTATVPEMTPPRPARRVPPPWSVEERRPASSSATPTGRRSHTSITSRSRGGARRRRRCDRRVASARADHGKLIAAVRRPPLVINRSLGRILIDTPVADKLLRHPVGAPFGSGRR